MKNWLIIYDISNEKRLQKIAKIMEGYGTRVQKSVFEMIAEEKIIKKLMTEVKNIIDENEDFVVYFDICNEDWQKQIKYGRGKFEIMENENYTII
ncbi:MAG: CRISPR-associated endonuclease Cas2 [Brevinematia bacterium]